MTRQHLSQGPDSIIPKEWINSRVTLDEIEGPNRAQDLIDPADSSEWRSFKSMLQAGDELWYFTAPSASFSHAAGRTGYVILRNGKQISHFNALMN